MCTGFSIQGVAMGLLDNSQDPFENFRREKKMRALQRELQRRMESRQGQILKLIEQEERTEVLERRIQREMHEFFEDSTKLAASVLAEVAEQKAREISAQITREMQEFFKEVLLRAERTIQGIRLSHPGHEPQADLETHLDPGISQAFGGQPKEPVEPGTATAPGQKSALSREPSPPPGPQADPNPPEEPSPEEEESFLDGGEVYVPEPEEEKPREPAQASGEVREIQMDQEDEFPPEGRAEEEGNREEDELEKMKGVLQSLAQDPAKLKKALTALYRAGVIEREEARSLFTTYTKG